MPLDYVGLQFAGTTRRACVRELCGADEEAVADSFTPSAIHLVDRLLVDRDGCLAPGASESLTAFDRDRLLAAVYRRGFTDRIESTVACTACGDRFDLNFSLDQLIASLESQRSDGGAEADGYVHTTDGAVFRLPNGREECLAATLPQQEARGLLRKAIVSDSSRPVSAAELDSLLERAAPLLDLDMDAMCPECARNQRVRFSMQTYLLESLLKERRRLVSDIHRVARAYGWSRREILELPRSERRQHVELIEAEAPPRRRISL